LPSIFYPAELLGHFTGLIILSLFTDVNADRFR
jgi:hypothetical protein